MKLLMLVVLSSLVVTGCSSKKIIAKNCEQTASAELFVCDKF